MITRMTSSPLLLRTCFAILKRMLNPNATLLSPQRNPLLKWLFKHTFYAQFCAGENKAEVQRTIRNVKHAGYTGVILEYALEVLKDDSSSSGAATTTTTADEIATWRQGMLDTVAMCSPGDFVALKWSGIGQEALGLLDSGSPPSPAMHAAMIEVCDRATEKQAALLPGAELEVTNVGIDRWTLDLQRRYNRTAPGKALVYTTYQSYLRSTPAHIARDLAIAQRQGFTLGIKLVRGAYLASEPREAVLESKAATDAAYDAIVAAVLTRTYNDVLVPADDYDAADMRFPPVAVMLASHNDVSVARARAIRDGQAARGEELVECSYAQLQGMADEISCGLVKASGERKAEREKRGGGDGVAGMVDVPLAFKCATWGSVGQCLNFLYRRALENQDAAGRTVETRKAMGLELRRRARKVVGLE
jgi:hypothetical protein